MEVAKINFFKKMWYSILKTSKYEDLRKEGLGKSIKYFFALISILAIILAIIASLVQSSVAGDTFKYLENTIPDLKYKDGILTIPDNKITVLNETKFIEYYKYVVVINPLLEKQEAIDEYKNLATNTNNVLVFIKDQLIIITNKYTDSKNEEGIDTFNYEEIFAEQIKDNSKEYGKNDIIEYLKVRKSFSYFLAQYFTYYLLSIAIIYILYILCISISMWIVTKILKIKWTIKKALMNTIYSSTLSVIAYVTYLIISYFAKFRITAMEIISLALIFIYIFLLVLKDKKEMQ